MFLRGTYSPTPSPQRRRTLSAAIGLLLVIAAGLAAATLLQRFLPQYVTAFRALPQLAAQKTSVHMEADAGDTSDGDSTRPVTTTNVISCEELAHVPGKSITTTTVEFPPNAYTPKHRHPGSVTVYVLQGRIRSQLGGGPVGEFGVGQSFFEPPGVIHLFAENASKTEPAEILAIFVADKDCGPLIIFEDDW